MEGGLRLHSYRVGPRQGRGESAYQRERLPEPEGVHSADTHEHRKFDTTIRLLRLGRRRETTEAGNVVCLRPGVLSFLLRHLRRIHSSPDPSRQLHHRRCPGLQRRDR